jgi:hypothetical protein
VRTSDGSVLSGRVQARRFGSGLDFGDIIVSQGLKDISGWTYRYETCRILTQISLVELCKCVLGEKREKRASDPVVER